MQLNEITGAIIGAAIKVHQKLGPGLLESPYKVCLAYELEKAGFRVEREKPIPVIYEGVKLDCGFRAGSNRGGRRETQRREDEPLRFSALSAVSGPCSTFIT